MTDDNLDDTQRLIQSKGYKDALKEGLEAIEKAVSVGKQEHCGVLLKDFNIIWNAAIEAAAKLCDKAHENATWSPAYQRPAKIIGEKIRKLKK